MRVCSKLARSMLSVLRHLPTLSLLSMVLILVQVGAGIPHKLYSRPRPWTLNPKLVMVLVGGLPHIEAEASPRCRATKAISRALLNGYRSLLTLVHTSGLSRSRCGATKSPRSWIAAGPAHARALATSSAAMRTVEDFGLAPSSAVHRADTRGEHKRRNFKQLRNLEQISPRSWHTRRLIATVHSFLPCPECRKWFISPRICSAPHSWNKS